MSETANDHRGATKKKSNADDRGDDGEHRRPAAEAHRHQRDREQVDHHLVRRLEERVHERGDAGGERDRDRRPGIARPPPLPPRLDAQMIAAAREQRLRRARMRVLDFPADHQHLEVGGAGDDPVRGGEREPRPEPLAARPADDDARRVARARVGENLLGDVPAAERDRDAAELFGEPQGAQDPVALGVGQALQARRLDVHRRPVALHPRGDARARTDGALRVRSGADADHDPLGDRPRRLDALVGPVLAHLPVDALRGAAQRHLAERDQVALAEEVLQRARRRLGHVDLAFVQALDQLVRREVDELHLVRVVEHVVGHRLPDADAGDLADDVVEALEMLDVHRRVDVDAGVQELLDVLPALGVARTGRVGVGELVDDDQAGFAREGGVEVELLQLHAAVGDALARQDLQPLEERRGLLPPVGLDQADDDVDALVALLARGREHRVGLADAGAGAEEDPQLAALLRPLLALNAGEELVGVGAFVLHRRRAAARAAPGS